MSVEPTRQNAFHISDETVERIVAGIDRYDEVNSEYDSVFWEVHERLAAAEEASKLDIAVIVFWKRSAQGKWIKDLLNARDSDVRTATRTAFAAIDDATALKALAVLPGFRRKEAIPTAMLCAFDPARWAVMDKRALRGLERLGCGVPAAHGLTLTYLDRTRGLSARLAGRRPGTTPRDIDKGLYIIGG